MDLKKKTKLPVSQSEAETAISNAESPDRALMSDLSRIERKDWWSWGFALLVILFLTGGIFALTLPSFFQNAESLFRIKPEEAVFGLMALIILFIIYAVHQQILIKRLRRQLAEKQGHSRILRNLAMIDPLTGLYNRRFSESQLCHDVAAHWWRAHFHKRKGRVAIRVRGGRATRAAAANRGPL